MTFSDEPSQAPQPPRAPQPPQSLQEPWPLRSVVRVLMFVTLGVVLAGVSANVDSVIIARAWEACIVDGDLEGGDGFALGLGVVLFWGVYAVVFVPSIVLALLVRSRWVVLAMMTLLVVGRLVIAWKYFAWSGLPLQNEYCPEPQPAWWPTWLPPSPGDF